MQPVVVAGSCGMDHCRFQVAALVAICVIRIFIAVFFVLFAVCVTVCVTVSTACHSILSLYTSHLQHWGRIREGGNPKLAEWRTEGGVWR